MELPSAVQAVFREDGDLSRAVPGFKPRVGQEHMAMEVAHTLQSGGVLAVEAGTGVGKTYAYLVPALLGGGRVIVSTATKALQDQLYGRDIPRLRAALSLPTRVAMLKGRASYLCLHRMELARETLGDAAPSILLDLSRVESWAVQTRSGDMAELALLDEKSPVMPLVTSTRDNCLGGRCPKAQACHVNQARREAMTADLVVVNHHLFFADINVRESGVAELLPSAACVIFDEAHQLNDIGVQFLGMQVTTGQIISLCRDLAAQGVNLALGSADWPIKVGEIQDGLTHLQAVAGESTTLTRHSWDNESESPAGLDVLEWRRAIVQLHRSLQAMSELLGRLA